MLAENPAELRRDMYYRLDQIGQHHKQLPDNQISTDLEKNPEFACIPLDTPEGDHYHLIAFCTDKFDEEFL